MGHGPTAPVESSCGPANDKTSNGLADATSAKLSKDAGDKLSSQLPTLEDKLRKQQDELDRLTDLLKQMQKTRDDVARAIAGS